MSSVELFPSVVPFTPEQMPEQNDDVAAYEYLIGHPHLVAPLKNFFAANCAPNATDFKTILSLGIVRDSIIIARHDESLSLKNPDAYLIKQYNIQDSTECDWDIYRGTYAGSGDQFEQTLFLSHLDQTAKLCLTNQNGGNTWTPKGSFEQPLPLHDARHLVTNVEYGLKKRGKTATALTIVPPLEYT